jgi:hypothetical protein
MLLALWVGPAISQCASADEGINLRLHLAWGGGEARQWRGRVAFSSGTLSRLQLLGVDTDEPGAIQLLGQQIIIRQKGPRAFDGLEVSVSAPADATIRIEFLALGESQAQVIQVPLSELVNGSRSGVLDDQGNRFVIRRTPADLIQVGFHRDHLVFSPGESLSGTARGYRLGIAPDTALRCRLQLVALGTDVALWEDELREQADASGSWPQPETFRVPLPRDEGVYELQIVISTRRRTPSFTPEKVIAERHVQLVVISHQPASAAGSVDPPDERQLVLGIDPTQANWFQRMGRLPQWSLLPGLRPDGPLGNVKADRLERGERVWMSLPVGGWQAYPLPVDEIGALHELELEFAGDLEQTFSVSIVEPNAAGKVIPIGVDSGVAIETEPDNPLTLRRPEVDRHRLLFWPKTETPLLLITNLSDKQAAVYGRFDVYRRSLPSAGPATAGARKAIAYFERPLFPEAFGAAEALDPQSGRSLEDWQTFLDGALRMIRYAKYVGYDALAVTCVSEGSTLYPSELLQPTPKHDRGIFFAVAQDPMRKDVLEMLFRLCDREGLQLIPVVEFASPLPTLEVLLSQPIESEGIELVDAAQATWLQRFEPQRGRAAYYNPLDGRVQQAMLDVLDELLARYTRHTSFGGIAINLHAAGYTQLPDVDWGMDALSWDRFRRERQVALTGPDQLDKSTQQKWLDWRCEQVTAFYGRIAQQLNGYRADSHLYLAGARLIDSRPVQRQFRPSLPPQVDAGQALREMGLAAAELQEIPNVVFLRPQLLVAPGAATPSPATAEFNRSADVDELFGQAADRGALFLHEPQLMRLPSFDETSPFGKSNTYLSLVAQVSPVGFSNRQRYAHLLASDDAQVFFDGGWLLPTGQEEQLREFLKVFRQLPRQTFDAVGDEAKKWQPLYVRTHTTADATYLYVVNDSPWYVGAAVHLDGPTETQYHALDSRPQQPVQRQRNGGLWTLTLAPYDLFALRADRPGVRVVDLQLNLPPDVRPGLENQIRSLGVRAAHLGNPTPLNVPSNRSFEAWDEHGLQPLGWTLRGRRDVVSVDPLNAHDGKAALRIHLPSGDLSIRSAEIKAPDAGRLSVSIWARVADPRQQPRVRLVLEVDGLVYYPWSPIGVGGEDRAMGKDWKEFVFRVSQLPPVNESLKIGIEVAGTGEVFLDDIRLFDTLVLDALEHKALAHLLSEADYQRRMGMVSECLEILDGYWPRYLLDNVPAVMPEVVDGPGPVPPPPPAAREASAWERLKRLLPR